jgi:hypothetical protein
VENFISKTKTARKFYVENATPLKGEVCLLQVEVCTKQNGLKGSKNTPTFISLFKFPFVFCKMYIWRVNCGALEK